MVGRHWPGCCAVNHRDQAVAPLVKPKTESKILETQP